MSDAIDNLTVRLVVRACLPTSTERGRCVCGCPFLARSGAAIMQAARDHALTCVDPTPVVTWRGDEYVCYD